MKQLLDRMRARLIKKSRKLAEVRGLGQSEEDAIYRELGRFVVFFQALESQLFELASFALDPEHTGHGRRSLAPLQFGSLVDKTLSSVVRFLDEHHGEEPEFRERLKALLDRCRVIARYRNRALHSAYVFLEGGDELVAILRSDMTGGGENEVGLDQELLNEDSFKEVMGEIAEVVFAIGQCHLQLIGWYRPGLANREA